MHVYLCKNKNSIASKGVARESGAGTGKWCRHEDYAPSARSVEDPPYVDTSDYAPSARRVEAPPYVCTSANAPIARSVEDLLYVSTSDNANSARGLEDPLYVSTTEDAATARSVVDPPMICEHNRRRSSGKECRPAPSKSNKEVETEVKTEPAPVKTEVKTEPAPVETEVKTEPAPVKTEVETEPSTVGIAPWKCTLCTYEHTSAIERPFLSCAMCAAELGYNTALMRVLSLQGIPGHSGHCSSQLNAALLEPGPVVGQAQTLAGAFNVLFLHRR